MFKPRYNSAGMKNNPYWYAENPFYLSGVGLPNCTCYAWGRAYEIEGKRPALPLGDAETWWNNVNPREYQKGSEPEIGAIICLANGPYSGFGHVAVVEQINADGSIVTSNSAYNGVYFYTVPRDITAHTSNKSNNYGYPEYDFQGFIYLRNTPIPPQPKNKNKMPIWMYLKKH